jgi:hypothetical protein
MSSGGSSRSAGAIVDFARDFFEAAGRRRMRSPGRRCSPGLSMERGVATCAGRHRGRGALRAAGFGRCTAVRNFATARDLDDFLDRVTGGQGPARAGDRGDRDQPAAPTARSK